MGGAEPPVLKVELIWRAGTPYEPKRALASVTNELLTEGTTRRGAGELEAFFEQYGTTLRSPDVMDTNNLGLSTIHRRAADVLPVLTEVILEPAFTEASFARTIRRRRQRLRENLSDNDTLAYRLITESVFGGRHPYGYNSFAEDYAGLTREDVVNFHRSHYHAGNATLFVVGKLNDEIEDLLEATFGQLPAGAEVAKPALPT
ncbi:MAG: insulinase family protein, partial [Bacteroidota bacterium]